jgi:hypothetical protein
MKVTVKIILGIILLPMWIVWFFLDLTYYWTDYKSWNLYDVFIRK